jgi:hypothetical protein
MATYTVTTGTAVAPADYAALGTRVTADVYNVNGGYLLVDCDSRYGLGGAVAASFGNITLSATLGGTIEFNSTKVRLIPFASGAGTVPAADTVIGTAGGASGKLIGVYSALNVAPTAAAAAMPVTGFIKVRGWNSTTYATATALTGISATTSAVDGPGWIECVGVDASTCTVNRLNSFKVRGDWYDFQGVTTTGTRTTTYQIPTNGSAVNHFPGVWVETAASSGVYEFYPRAGTATALVATINVEAARGKFCWVAALTGLLTLGSDGTNSTGGFIPAAGLHIRIPNIFFVNCVAAASVNVVPSTTLTTRYKFVTTGGGVIDMDKCCFNWGALFAQAFSVALTNVAIMSNLTVTECAQPVAWDNVGIGQEAAATNNTLVMGLCFAGGTISNCTFVRSALATAVYINQLTDCTGFTFTNCRTHSLATKANVGAGSWFLTRAVNCTWVGDRITGAKVIIVACTNLTWTNTHYNDVLGGITATTSAQNNSVWELVTSNSSNLMFDGLDFNGILNTAPYIAILSIVVAGCSFIKLRNIGTYAAPLALGTATVFTGAVILGMTAGACSDLKVQRVYCANTRLNGIYFGSATVPDNSSSDWIFENVFTDYADNADLGVILGLVRKGIGCVPSVAASASIYGTHFIDCHTSATAGRICILMNESTATTAGQVTLTNGAAFTSAGGLYMPVIGQTAMFELPYYCIGHTGFSATAGTMAGGTVGNYTFGFQIDKNDGAGWSTLTSGQTAATLATAMNALTGISAVNGFKVRIKITTSVTNATAITSFFILTTSTTTTQAYQYPLETYTVTFSGIEPGSDVTVTTSNTNTTVGSVDQNATSSWGYTYSGAQMVDIKIIKAGFVPYAIYDLVLTTTNSTIPIAQTADRNYQ